MSINKIAHARLLLLLSLLFTACAAGAGRQPSTIVMADGGGGSSGDEWPVLSSDLSSDMADAASLDEGESAVTQMAGCDADTTAFLEVLIDGL